MRYLLSLCFLIFNLTFFGQSRIVLNDGVWIVVDSSFLVIGNPSDNAITISGSGGNISSEGEFDRIRWSIGNSTGNYIVPFTSPSGVKMPLSCDIVSPGSNDGSVVFSTYNWGNISPSWNNNLYRPSDVSHMGFPDGSDQSVDRFWIIDTQLSGFGYSTNPTINLSFVYDRGEVSIGNIINNNTILSSQRFNNLLNAWGDYLPPPGTFLLNSPGPMQNSLISVSIPPSQFFRSWTLTNIGQPLPIELSSFYGHCEDYKIHLNWSTSSEFENDYFIIERSDNGIEFDSIGLIDGSGNSLETIDYSFMDYDTQGDKYYRINQVDFDGSSSQSDIIFVGCQNQQGVEIISIFSQEDNIQMSIMSDYEFMSGIKIIDLNGKEIISSKAQINNGTTIIRLPRESISSGIYFITVSSDIFSDSRKFALLD